jgi:hypothetical protein
MFFKWYQSPERRTHHSTFQPKPIAPPLRLPGRLNTKNRNDYEKMTKRDFFMQTAFTKQKYRKNANRVFRYNRLTVVSYVRNEHLVQFALSNLMQILNETMSKNKWSIWVLFSYLEKIRFKQISCIKSIIFKGTIIY